MADQLPTSAKFQLISGDNPTIHEVDQRVSTGKFDGDATGDHHATIFEIDPVTGTVKDFLARISGHALASLAIPFIHAISGLDLDQNALDFLLQHGDAINAGLAKVNVGGESLRIALMDGTEE